MGTCSDLFCPRAYDSLKDFQDIYEVAALKWKVGALQGVTRQTVPWEGGEARRHPAVQLSPCWDISARLGIVHWRDNRWPLALHLPVHLQCGVLVKSTESQTPLVSM